MFGDWKSLIPIVSSVVAIVAVILTYKQIKLSNKQHLFDKRMENYIIATGLIKLYRSNCNDINNEKDEPMLSNDFDFNSLTNNTYLEQITCAIDNPLKEPNHKELLIKLENLKEVATKIKFLFSGNASNLLGDFVLRYQELLFEMYRYQIILDKIIKQNENGNHALEFDELAKKFKEEKYRDRVQKAFNNLKQANSCLEKENVEEQIEKQIRLL
ncbi:hypothetical protein SAMN02745134_00345 [Clostridium acidisoli DSM 12555]|uniref:Uncharacterized protein n=1 Tax=Clostridium acidisoli DSM 12555 TaxID=1121291 RepID=A0A1W1X244_9CLOT|nr:hypothetical protein [Clostridium acidisoli]SMC17481.1 hypothetical protein SAMN02745134_00345 [Clostridium acidisoli DSM 12555]